MNLHDLVMKTPRGAIQNIACRIRARFGVLRFNPFA